MLGLLTWMEPQKGKRQKRIVVRESSILHMRCQQAAVLRGSHTPQNVLRRRMTEALKRMKKAGVTRVILPDGIVMKLPEGMADVSAVPLRQAMAANWAQYELAKKQLTGVQIAVSADRLTGEVVRTVTELALRYRYVSVSLPFGGEELTRQLRREYGVSLLLNPERTRMEEAEALILFGERPDLSGKNPVLIPVYHEEIAMPTLLLPAAMEEQVPTGINREKFLTALMQAGVIRPRADLTF